MLASCAGMRVGTSRPQSQAETQRNFVRRMTWGEAGGERSSVNMAGSTIPAFASYGP